MLKAVIAFTLCDFFLSLIAIRIPLFRRRSKKWKEETYLQRFCAVFFPSLIAFVILVVVSNYKSANMPSDFEKMLDRGDMAYYLITDLDEIGNADIVFEIKKDSDQQKICEIISCICKELNRASSDVCVYPKNEEFVIMDHNETVGIVTVFEKKYGLLLKFIWEE